MEMKSLSFLLSLLFLSIFNLTILFISTSSHIFVFAVSVCLPVRSSVRPLLDRQQLLNWCQASIALHCVLWHCVYDGIHSLFWCDTERRIHPSKESAHACVFLCVCVCVCLWWGRSGGTQSPTQWGLDGGFSSRPQQVFLSLHATAVVYRAECFVVKRLQFLGRCERFVRQPSAIPCSCRRFTEWNCLLRLETAW